MSSEGPPFLPRAPSPRVIAAAGWLLAALALSGAVFVTAVALPETVSGRFELVSSDALRPLPTPEDGVITAVTLRVGERARAGAPLVRLDSRAAARKGVDRLELYRLDQARDADQALLEATLTARKLAAEAEERQLTERLRYLERAAAVAAEDRGRAGEELEEARALAAGGAAAQAAVADARHALRLSELEVDRLASQRLETLAALEGARQRMALVELEAARDRASWEQRAELERAELSVLERELTELDGPDGGALAVSAPCDGTLLLLTAAVGQLVSRGAELGVFGCDGGAVEARVSIPEASVGKVQPGQQVWLLMDAFPYQHFGARRGEVRWVGGGADGFEARVAMEQRGLTTDGHLRPFLPGMGGSARIEVARRPLIWQLAAPLRGVAELAR